MRPKRTRNHYPRLPDAVQNLLALHSLVAVARKDRPWHNGAAVGWVFDVFHEKIVVGKRRTPIFDGRAGDDLQKWIGKVDRYLEHGPMFSMDFKSVPSNTSLDKSGWLHYELCKYNKSYNKS